MVFDLIGWATLVFMFLGIIAACAYAKKVS